MEVCLADDVVLRARRAHVTFWSVAVGHPLLLPEPAAESQSSDEQVLLARAVHSRLFPQGPGVAPSLLSSRRGAGWARRPEAPLTLGTEMRASRPPLPRVSLLSRGARLNTEDSGIRFPGLGPRKAWISDRKCHVLVQSISLCIISKKLLERKAPQKPQVPVTPRW